MQGKPGLRGPGEADYGPGTPHGTVEPSQPNKPGLPASRHCAKLASRATHCWPGSQHSSDTGKFRPAHLRPAGAQAPEHARGGGGTTGGGGRVVGFVWTGGFGVVPPVTSRTIVQSSPLANACMRMASLRRRCGCAGACAGVGRKAVLGNVAEGR